MPASNQLLDFTAVRAQVSGGGLKWASSDPGTTGSKIMTWGEFYSYVKNTGVNAYSSTYCPPWSVMQTYRKLNASDYAASLFNTGSMGVQTSTSWYAPSGQFTIEGWVRRRSGLPNNVTLAGHGNGANDPSGDYVSWGWSVFVDPTSVYIALAYGDDYIGYGLQGNTVSYTFSNATWYHLAVTVNTSASMHVYVNGSSIYSGQGSSGAQSLYRGTASSSSHPFFIGAGITDSGNTSNGDVDEVRYWNYERSAAQIAANMNETIHSESGLLVSCPFENTYADATGNYTMGLYSGALSYVTDTAL